MLVFQWKFAQAWVPLAAEELKRAMDPSEASKGDAKGDSKSAGAEKGDSQSAADAGDGKEEVKLIADADGDEGDDTEAKAAFDNLSARDLRYWREARRRGSMRFATRTLLESAAAFVAKNIEGVFPLIGSPSCAHVATLSRTCAVCVQSFANGCVAWLRCVPMAPLYCTWSVPSWRTVPGRECLVVMKLVDGLQAAENPRAPTSVLRFLINGECLVFC